MLNSLAQNLLSQVRGQYRVEVVSGTIAAALAASAQLFQFRWTDTSNLAIILKLRARILPLTAFTAATLTDHTSLDAFVCRPISAGGGGTALTLTGNNAKLRTSMATSLAAARIATTAALTAVTGMDSHPFAGSLRKGNRANPAAATEETLPTWDNELTYEPDYTRGEYPLVLAANEGFVIRNRTVWPAAGTGVLQVECAWAEVPNFV